MASWLNGREELLAREVPSLRESPFISVIVTAFNRRQFLLHALRSVMRQTLNRSKYEVIVVKNFLDQNIDLELQRLRAISIIKGNENIGAYLVDAIRNSAGEVLVFLDDDDEFEENKLQLIYDIFKKYEQIGYFHNDRVLIDAESELIDNPRVFRLAETKNMQKIGSFRVEMPLSKADADRLYLVSAYSYMSSLAIRRSALTPFLKYLGLIEHEQDYFMFYSALISQRHQLAIHSGKLTRYRLHESNVSTSGHSTIKPNSQKVFDLLEQKKVRVARAMTTFELILQMAKNATTTSIVKKMILHDLWSRKFIYDFASSQSNSREMFADSLLNARYHFPRNIYAQGTLLAYGFVYPIFPEFAIRRFVARQMKYW